MRTSVCNHSQGLLLPSRHRERSIDFRVLSKQTNKQTNKMRAFVPHNLSLFTTSRRMRGPSWVKLNLREWKRLRGFTVRVLFNQTLLTLYYSLLTTYYLLFTPGAAVAVKTYFIVLTTDYSHYTYAYYLLLTTYSRWGRGYQDVLHTTYYLLVTSYYLRSTPCYLLLTIYYLLQVRQWQ